MTRALGMSGDGGFRVLDGELGKGFRSMISQRTRTSQSLKCRGQVSAAGAFLRRREEVTTRSAFSLSHTIFNTKQNHRHQPFQDRPEMAESSRELVFPVHHAPRKRLLQHPAGTRAPGATPSSCSSSPMTRISSTAIPVPWAAPAEDGCSLA